YGADASLCSLDAWARASSEGRRGSACVPGRLRRPIRYRVAGAVAARLEHAGRGGADRAGTWRIMEVVLARSLRQSDRSIAAAVSAALGAAARRYRVAAGTMGERRWAVAATAMAAAASAAAAGSVAGAGTQTATYADNRNRVFSVPVG